MGRRKTVVYTKQCSDGSTCRSPLDETVRAYIADEYEICDNCLMSRYGVVNATYDRCSDPWAMDALYREEDVVAALRSATGL